MTEKRREKKLLGVAIKRGEKGRVFPIGRKKMGGPVACNFSDYKKGGCRGQGKDSLVKSEEANRGTLILCKQGKAP